ncbi:MAG: WxL domain-containing protein [Kurthia sp.]|nr:WxL domain-containing protein [Candidatus Kurthia equi]
MKLVKYGAVAALVASIGATTLIGLQASAADSGVTGSESDYLRSMDSKATLNFVPDNSVTKPIDPIDPTNPNPPTPLPPKPGTPGPLSIDYASDFNFGMQEISTETKSYYAKPQTYSDNSTVRPNFVQVTDKRGTNAGWTLSVKQAGQFSNPTTQNKTLDGAQLILGKGETVTNGSAATPTTYAVLLDPSGTTSKVMSADTNQGTGTWVNLFGGKNALQDVTVKDPSNQVTTEKRDFGVKLTVPGATQKDAVQYATTLTWELTNVPTNPTAP